MKILKIIIPLLLFLPLISFAEVGLSVAPQKFEFTIFPGSSHSGQIKIHNPSSIPLPVDVKALPFGAKEGSGDFVPGISDSPENPKSWITLERENLLLSPGANERVNFKIEVPADAPRGGYYLFIHLSPRIPDWYIGRSGVRAIPTMGIPIMIATTELALDMDLERDDLMVVERFEIEGSQRVGILENLLGKSPALLKEAHAKDRLSGNTSFQITRTRPDTFLLTIKNNDIFHFRPEGNLTIRDSFGKEIAQSKIEGKTILPGLSRDFLIKIDRDERGEQITKRGLINSLFADLMVGRYSAELDLKGYSPVREVITPYGGGSIINIFTVYPLVTWVVFITFFTLLFLIRKRLIFAFKVFFKKA